MTASARDYVQALDAAHRLTLEWLSELPERRVPPRVDADAVATALGELPREATDPVDVVELLSRACGPGLTAMPSGRFFGFVIGGTLPAAMAGDWLVSAWDQNSGLRRLTPAMAAVEEVTGQWLLDLLGLPEDSGVGFVTGATMSNFTCLAAARDAVLRRAGWDVPANGLNGGPQTHVLVGAERHDTVDLALRYLGLGVPVPVEVDEQGRILPDALAREMEARDGPTIVVLQAGNVHSGAFDDFGACIEVAHRHDAWVHVDGAFGLFAAASRDHRHLVEGVGGADSWTTDAHKTLNVPYDCGIAVVRDRDALRSAMSMHGDYLVHDEAGEPLDRVPEVSRRARGVPVWAALRSLGREGVAEMVDRFCHHARSFAEALAEMPGVEVVNDVVFTQVCASFGTDARTRQVIDAMMADGTAWMTGSRWHGRAVLRISVSNWSTDEADVQRSLGVLRGLVERLPPLAGHVR